MIVNSVIFRFYPKLVFGWLSKEKDQSHQQWKLKTKLSMIKIEDQSHQWWKLKTKPSMVDIENQSHK